MNEEIIIGKNPIESYQKPLTYIGAALIAITLGYLGFTRFYLEPKQTEAAAEIYIAEGYFDNDSFALALNGNASFAGFEEIADDYSITDAGNLAHYYAGICNLKLGASAKDSTKAIEFFEEAVKHLTKFSTDSKILGPIALGATGDAYSELREYEKAVGYYEKAASAYSNEYTTPMFLKKAGLVYERLGQFEKATIAYKKIKDKFGKTSIGTQIDKYISRAENRQ